MAFLSFSISNLSASLISLSPLPLPYSTEKKLHQCFLSHIGAHHHPTKVMNGNLRTKIGLLSQIPCELMDLIIALPHGSAETSYVWKGRTFLFPVSSSFLTLFLPKRTLTHSSLAYGGNPLTNTWSLTASRGEAPSESAPPRNARSCPGSIVSTLIKSEAVNELLKLEICNFCFPRSCLMVSSNAPPRYIPPSAPRVHRRTLPAAHMCTDTAIEAAIIVQAMIATRKRTIGVAGAMP